MKIALFGHGNMGKEIERLTNELGKHQIVSIGSQRGGNQIDEEGIKNADVVIDFTSPEVVVENISRIASLGKNMVVGTTGWYEHLSEVEEIIKKAGIGLIYAQNFSVGANIFFQIITNATRLFNKFEGYDVYGLEIHHKGKKDSPSGTALRIAREINGLQFASIRAGRNPGFHQVVFDSSADSIILSHQAHNRSGFAAGALLAAEFIQGKKGLHSFDEIFKGEIS